MPPSESRALGGWFYATLTMHMSCRSRYCLYRVLTTTNGSNREAANRCAAVAAMPVSFADPEPDPEPPRQDPVHSLGLLKRGYVYE